MSKTKSAVSFSRKQIFQIAKAYALSDYSHVHFEKEFPCSKLLLKAEQFHGKCKADSFFQALIQKRNMSKS